MRVLLVHQAASPEQPSDAADVLVQRDAVIAALTALGHHSECHPATLDLAALDHALTETQPDVVFNLVEALGDTDRLMPLAPMLLEARGVPMTGCPAACITSSTDKVAAKQRLRAMGVPTPASYAEPSQAEPSQFEPSQAEPPFKRGQKVVLKAIWEHASFGLDDQSIVAYEGPEALRTLLARRLADTGAPHFAEAFVEGREFNISLLEDGAEVCVLPPAEIDFSGMAPDQARIVGYAAKWDDDSSAALNTPRTFDFPASDQPLLARIEDVARQTWHAFGARGYARVDIRVDADGQPQVLELNANPCLSPDAGFAAATARAGYDYRSTIAALCGAALRHRPQKQT